MKKSTSIYVLLIVSVLIGGSHFSLKPLDNGRILVLDGMEIDLLGIAKINGQDTPEIVQIFHF